MKTCSQCGETKPATEYRRRSSCPDGLRKNCKACCSAGEARWAVANSARKRAKDRAYGMANRDARIARAAAWVAANADSHREKGKAWRAANAASLAEARRLKRERDGEAIRARRRQHYQDNLAHYKAQAAFRKAHVRLATPSWADRAAIASFYELAALVTEETGTPHHVDHVVPLRSKGVCGLNVYSNLQILSKDENLRKSNSFKEAA